MSFNAHECSVEVDVKFGLLALLFTSGWDYYYWLESDSLELNRLGIPESAGF